MSWFRSACACALLTLVSVRPAEAQDESPWAGTWVTDEGVITLTQSGADLQGAYGRGNVVKATVTGAKAEGTYRIGNVTGRVQWELAADGRFTGTWTNPNGSSGAWRGWKQDPKAEERPNASFSGHWLTSLGTFRLEQKGAEVEGPWRHAGWDTIKGTVKGRRLTGTLTRPTWSGKVWLEVTADGKRLYGATEESPAAAVIGLKPQGFEARPKLKAGEVAKGVSENGMLYFLRPSDAWQAGTGEDAIVLLHGSNWTTAGMVWATAKSWPAIAKGFTIVGVQGDTWSPWSDADDLRFNYHYVNWMGRSTYKGYPWTERDSPYLVSEVVAELTKKHGFKRVFIGGHSQGGFMAYLMHMHYPEQFAGSFPVAGGMIVQAEPDVFEDAKLKALQRARPMAVVHGRSDDVVPHQTALYVRERYEQHDFPLMTLIEPDLGHPYDFLPIGDAVRYLDALTAPKAEPLAAYAREAVAAKRWHDVGACLVRARELKAEAALASASAALDAAAKAGAARFLTLLEKGEPGDWVDELFTWKRDFGAAPAAAATMAAYAKVRSEHDVRAEALMDEAEKAFRSNDRDTGRARYEDIVTSCWASGRYPSVRRWLAEMR